MVASEAGLDGFYCCGHCGWDLVEEENEVGSLGSLPILCESLSRHIDMVETKDNTYETLQGSRFRAAIWDAANDVGQELSLCASSGCI